MRGAALTRQERQTSSFPEEKLLEPNPVDDTGTRRAFVFQRTLTFAERVTYQRAIEDVYWRHRIWPKENPGRKPSLDAVMPQEQLEKKVEYYLCKSQLVVDHRGWPIAASDLQAEMERMARDTKRPDVLRELFEALGRDPFVIAECLARPVLAERFSSDLTPEAAVSAAVGKLFAVDTAASIQNYISGTNLDNASYKLPEITIPTDCIDDTWAANTTMNAPQARDAPIETAIDI